MGHSGVVDKTFDRGVLTLGLKAPCLFHSRAFRAFPTHWWKEAQWMGHSGLSIKLLTVGVLTLGVEGALFI